MAINVKACVALGIGCVASIAYGLSQAESSLSVREKLAFEGYVLISEKEGIAEAAWKERAKLYKKEPHTLLLENLKHEDVLDDGSKLKNECEKYTSKKVPTNTLADGVYEKLIKLCTVTIKEYIESHLNTKDDEEKIIGQDQTNDWKEIYDKKKEEIVKVLTNIKQDNHKEELNKFCQEAFRLQKSNKYQDKEYQANQWCVKRKEKPKALSTKTEDGADEDSNSE